MKCAAFELPIRDGEQFGKLDLEKLCRFLAEDLHLLRHSGDSWHWVSDSYPADSVSLRAVSSDNFLVIDITGDHHIIGEVDFPAALPSLSHARGARSRHISCSHAEQQIIRYFLLCRGKYDVECTCCVWHIDKKTSMDATPA